MCKVKMLRTLVKQRLNVAVEEIIELFERTIAEYEEQLRRSKDGNEIRRWDDVSKPRVLLLKADVQQAERQEEVPSQKREDPAKPAHIKEEEEDVWSSQAAEKLPGPKETDFTEFTWTGIHVKSENDEGQSSQLHHNPGEEASSQHVAIKGAGEHRTPLWDMDDVMSHSSDTDHSDDDKEPLKTKKKSKGPHHSDGKHFDCSECGKTFTNKSVLKNHMVTHTGEKPFICTVCDKRFSLKHHMKRHMSVHEGGKAFFPCSVCDKRFQDEAAMKEHVRTHAMEKALTSGSTSQNIAEADDDDDAPLSDMDYVLSQSSDSDHSDDAKEPLKMKKKKSDGDLTYHAETKLYICSGCGKTFTNKSVLRNHMVTHTGEKPFACSVCDKRFSFKQNMRRHMAIHTGEKPHSCGFCDKRFYDKFEMKRHMLTHTSEKPFTCSVCAKSFNRSSHFRMHMKRHASEKPSTSSSSSQHVPTEADGEPGEDPRSQANNFAPLSDMEDMMSQSSDADHSDDPKEPSETLKNSEVDVAHPADGKQFNCSICDKTVANKGSLKTHMLTHTGEKPFACPICDKRFSIKQNMKRHMAIHTGEKPYSCSVCAKRFYVEFEMKRHKRIHTSEKPFMCSLCGKSFSCSNYLTLHLSTHTSEKPFACAVCAKNFSHKSYLRQHMRIHATEKPFTCSVCSKGFSSRSYLRIHMSLHTGEKIFRCSFCDKSYSRRSQFRKHMRTHAGEKSFTCSVCANRFIDLECLIVHMRKHAEDNPLASSSSSQLMAAEADGEPADNFAPLSDLDDVMSQSSDTEHSDQAEEPLETIKDS
ncbi:zinc finger protein 271-like [Hippocampus zosterae]|uniref:zinc finger protein 271-like n=1 Tax=Hippocampus zosterae TaxID=109293 RepID=UPI00223CF4CA|nr:zinc finger protein 271-like [Hippocampus zosterae]